MINGPRGTDKYPVDRKIKKGGCGKDKIMGKLLSLIYKFRMDIIVIASLLLISLLVLLVVDLTKEEGAYVEITVDGDTVGKYSLEKDGTYSVNGGSNIITVKDGVAYMSYSSCPDHVCENTGEVKHVGQTVICLPNRVTVTVIGESDDAVDLVS